MATSSNEGMIGYLKRRGVLTSDRLERALRHVPREFFVSEKYRGHAYADTSLPIGKGQTISQPLVVVRMTQLLGPEKGEKVMEIGAGSGWQAAILSKMVERKGEVYALEVVPELARKARKRLEELDIENVEIVLKDGSVGFEEKASFDRIMCTARCPEVPEEWKEQVKEGGRIVAPVGNRFIQSLVVLEKRDGNVETVEKDRGYRFVKLRGEKGF